MVVEVPAWQNRERQFGGRKRIYSVAQYQQPNGRGTTWSGDSPKLVPKIEIWLTQAEGGLEWRHAVGENAMVSDMVVKKITVQNSQELGSRAVVLEQSSHLTLGKPGNLWFLICKKKGLFYR